MSRYELLSRLTAVENDFKAHRPFLIGLAYRMLASVTEAEDIVQDAFVRWSSVDRATVENPRAFLARTVSRLCLDRMKSAVARRERYVGTWLPEPLVAPAGEDIANDLSVALLLTLERLSPLERAAFLLHDVFDMDYATVGAILGRSDIACRQLAARGREHVREERPRFETSAESTARIVDAFEEALHHGRLDQLTEVLATDAAIYTDGGGKRAAALNPVRGIEKVGRFFAGMTKKAVYGGGIRIERVTLNGLPGFVVWTDDGPETISLEIADDRLVAIYVVRNPEKLRHLS